MSEPRTILVTGGNAGIGHGMAERFHADGHRVVIAGRRQDALDAVAAGHAGMETLQIDQSDAASIAAAAAEAIRRFPALDTLVNNAGIQRFEDLKTGAIEDAEAQVVTNLLGPIRLTAALIGHLIAQPGASIINVTSALAFMPQARTPTYSATKAGMHAYTLSLRHQLADTGVRVIEVVPPKVQTGLQGKEGFDPAAMPLGDYIDEVFALLTDPTREEVIVERARGFRYADRDGRFEAAFAMLNGQPAQ